MVGILDMSYKNKSVGRQVNMSFNQKTNLSMNLSMLRKKKPTPTHLPLSKKIKNYSENQPKIGLGLPSWNSPRIGCGCGGSH